MNAAKLRREYYGSIAVRLAEVYEIVKKNFKNCESTKSEYKENITRYFSYK